jgi:hypothetical protein
MKYLDDASLPEMTDEEFLETLQKSRPYTVVILRAGPNFKMPGPGGDPTVTAIIRQHGKRNIALRKAGIMPIIAPIGDGSGITGIGVFDASPDDVKRIYSLDPGVKAGVFTFEVHPSRSFPGSTLAEPEAGVQEYSPRPAGLHEPPKQPGSP